MQIMQEHSSALPLTAMEDGNAERLSGTISAVLVGKASAPAHAQVTGMW